MRLPRDQAHFDNHDGIFLVIKDNWYNIQRSKLRFLVIRPGTDVQLVGLCCEVYKVLVDITDKSRGLLRTDGFVMERRFRTEYMKEE
jgi:hypothetical protein